MEDKPKTALDWINWAREQKKTNAAPPAAEPPASTADADTKAEPDPPAPAEPPVVEESPVSEDLPVPDDPPVSDDPPVPDEPVAAPAEAAPAPTTETTPVEVTPVEVVPVEVVPVEVVPVEVVPVEVAPVEVVSVEVVPAEVMPPAGEGSVAAEQAPVQEPPALPTHEAVDETAGCETVDEDFEADFPTLESRDDPVPPPPAAELQLPAASNSTVFIPENSAYAFASSDFNFIEAEGHELANVEIIALAGDGSLRFDHVDITMGQMISKADIDAGRFVFIPARVRTGVSHDSFLYKVHDGESCSRVAYTMTIKAWPVDD
ncbi:MAG: hypothetical protein ACYST0_03305 [Planctomycetota bacterium]